jgi:hypothetical protein
MLNPVVQVHTPADVCRTVDEHGVARWSRLVDGGRAHLVTRRQGGYLVTRLERVEPIEATPEVDDLNFASLM